MFANCEALALSGIVDRTYKSQTQNSGNGLDTQTVDDLLSELGADGYVARPQTAPQMSGHRRIAAGVIVEHTWLEIMDSRFWIATGKPSRVGIIG